jgi:precorrin-2 dehydrogenase/sirohydrochlorin ferrochelatase
VTLADDVLPPAFFPVSLNVAGRRCVVIGPADAGEAAEKVEALRESGAVVDWITDASTLRDADVIDAFFVISTPLDEALSQRLRALADRHRFLLCCIDQPRYGVVALQAVVKAGRARLAISTGGVSPRVGAILRASLQRALDGRFADFLERLALLRRRSRAELPDAPEERRARMRAAAEGFEVDVRVQYPAWFTEEQGSR